jgi:hypothetical protein
MKKVLTLCAINLNSIIPYDAIGGQCYSELDVLSTRTMSNPLIIILIGSGLLALATIRIWWKR